VTRTDYQIGQHLVIGLVGRELNAASRHLLNTIRPGGVVLFARNVGSAGELRALARALRREFSFRPLVFIDEENGRVNRLREIIGELPTIADVKRGAVPEKAEDLGRIIGRWLHQFNIDVNFAPVFDLEFFDAGTDNALAERCWGKTAMEVILWAGAFLEGLEREGIAACPKHFPGLGRATLDSHEKLPTITGDVAEDIEPYRHFMRRLTAIMVGHAKYPALEDKPASLSRKVITDLLRRQLGFNGLVFTDDLEMGAITDFESAVADAIRAGADMLLVCHTPEKILAAHKVLSQLPETCFAESQKRIQTFRDEWIGHKI
jgi:beta-N-acetylhexosaminidase